MNLVRNPKFAVPVVLLLLAALFFGLNLRRNESAATLLAVRVTTMSETSLSAQVTATGVTEALGQVDVKAKTAAGFTRAAVDEGQNVKKGDLLGRFRALEITAQLAKVESTASQARAQAALTLRKHALEPDKHQQDLAATQRHLQDAEMSLEKVKEGTADQLDQAKRALADAQGAYGILKNKLDATLLTESDLAVAEASYDSAFASYRTNARGSIAGTPEDYAAYASFKQAQAALDHTQTQYKTQADDAANQLAQAQRAVDATKQQLDRLQNGGTNREIALAQSQLDDAAAALEQVKLQYELTRTTDDDVAAAQAAARAADAAYQQALEDYKTPDILSPIDGKVLAVYVKEGDMVAPGAPLFTIGATHDLVVKAKVDEVDIGKVSVGQTAKVTSAAFVGKVFEGTVTKLAPRAIRDGNISVFIAEITVKNPDDMLKPGMNVDVEISSNRSDAVLALPLEAVLDRTGQKVVFVLDGSVVHQRKVTTGIMTQTQVEITDGLKEGDKVVTGPSEVLAKLKDGDRVKVQP